MTRAIDVVWRIADDDEVFRREIELQVFANALGCECGQIATIVRLVTERTRQREKLLEPDQLHLQISHRFYVAGEKRRSIARMAIERFECFARAGNQLEKRDAVAGDLLRLRRE